VGQLDGISRQHQLGAAIDATRSVTVVHQVHDYSHLPGNKPPYGSEVAKRNLVLAGGRKCVYNVLDTDKELINGKVRRPKFLLARVFRRLERYFITDTMGGWRGQVSIRFGRMERALAGRQGADPHAPWPEPV